MIEGVFAGGADFLARDSQLPEWRGPLEDGFHRLPFGRGVGVVLVAAEDQVADADGVDTGQAGSGAEETFGAKAAGREADRPGVDGVRPKLLFRRFNLQ